MQKEARLNVDLPWVHKASKHLRAHCTPMSTHNAMCKCTPMSTHCTPMSTHNATCKCTPMSTHGTPMPTHNASTTLHIYVKPQCAHSTPVSSHNALCTCNTTHPHSMHPHHACAQTHTQERQADQVGQEGGESSSHRSSATISANATSGTTSASEHAFMPWDEAWLQGVMRLLASVTDRHTTMKSGFEVGPRVPTRP